MIRNRLFRHFLQSEVWGTRTSKELLALIGLFRTRKHPGFIWEWVWGRSEALMPRVWSGVAGVVDSSVQLYLRLPAWAAHTRSHVLAFQWRRCEIRVCTQPYRFPCLPNTNIWPADRPSWKSTEHEIKRRAREAGAQSRPQHPQGPCKHAGSSLKRLKKSQGPLLFLTYLLQLAQAPRLQELSRGRLARRHEMSMSFLWVKFFTPFLIQSHRRVTEVLLKSWCYDRKVWEHITDRVPMLTTIHHQKNWTMEQWKKQ